MKLYRYILFIILSFSIVNASHIKWNWDYEKALIKAKKENKSMMIVVRKDNCIECQKMFEITFKNQAYLEQINKEFICVIVTYENKNSYPIEMFYTLIFPAVFFINSKDESFSKLPLFGFVSPEELLIYIKLMI
jgi:thioredoxin-related protein